MLLGYTASNTVWLTSRTVYDSFGRVALSTSQFLLPGTTAQGQGSAAARATRSLYDSAGRVYKTEQLKDVIVEIQNGVAVVTDEGTVVSSTEPIFDSQGRTKRTIAADGQITDIEYDELGNQSATIGHPVPAEEVGWGALNPGKLVRHRAENFFCGLTPTAILCRRFAAGELRIPFLLWADAHSSFVSLRGWGTPDSIFLWADAHSYCLAPLRG